MKGTEASGSDTWGRLFSFSSEISVTSFSLTVSSDTADTVSAADTGADELIVCEGTGALCSYPIIVSAVNMMNEMNNFENANITKYF